MKRPFAYITAPWTGTDCQNSEKAIYYCRQVYDAGYTPICPLLVLTPFLNDRVPQGHKDGLDMSRDFLRRSHVLVVCGNSVTEGMKNDIATATTLEGILTVKGQGRGCGKK